MCCTALYQDAEATKCGCRASLGLSHQIALSYSPVSLCVSVYVYVYVGWMESRPAVCQCVGSSLLSPPLCRLGVLCDTEGPEVVLHLSMNIPTRAIYSCGDWSANKKGTRAEQC